MTPIEDLLMEQMMENVKSLPPLPPGWKYDFDQEVVFNQDTKCYDCKLIATPRQVYKIKED